MGVGWSEEDPFSHTQPSQEVPFCNNKQHEVEKTKVKLPHNYEEIIKDADSQIDESSAEKINDQLHAGPFLNGKKKKYCVPKESGSNTFTLFARDLSITWAENKRYWKWTSLKETSEVFVDVAELLNVCWLEIHVKFDTTKLTPNSLYEVAFVIMVKKEAYGWDVPVNLRVQLPDGDKIEHKENLAIKPRDQWIEIRVGKFTLPPEKAGEMEISLYEYEGGKWKKGLVIKAVVIRPIN